CIPQPPRCQRLSPRRQGSQTPRPLHRTLLRFSSTGPPSIRARMEPSSQRLPSWVLGETRRLGAADDLKRRLRAGKLVTVCEQARCPNIGECFSAGTATFMILGENCTRRCSFCSVKTGRGAAPDPAEPARVAETAAALGLKYVVLT